MVNAKGVGSPNDCINCLGYVAFNGNPWCMTNIEGGWGSGHLINCLGYVAFNKKHVGYDGSGVLVTVSTACVMWLSGRYTWETMGLELW
jgi:hypothetical protein